MAEDADVPLKQQPDLREEDLDMSHGSLCYSQSVNFDAGKPMPSSLSSAAARSGGRRASIKAEGEGRAVKAESARPEAGEPSADGRPNGETRRKPGADPEDPPAAETEDKPAADGQAQGPAQAQGIDEGAGPEAEGESEALAEREAPAAADLEGARKAEAAAQVPASDPEAPQQEAAAPGDAIADEGAADAGRSGGIGAAEERKRVVTFQADSGGGAEPRSALSALAREVEHEQRGALPASSAGSGAEAPEERRATRLGDLEASATLDRIKRVAQEVVMEESASLSRAELDSVLKSAAADVEREFEEEDKTLSSAATRLAEAAAAPTTPTARMQKSRRGAKVRISAKAPKVHGSSSPVAKPKKTRRRKDLFDGAKGGGGRSSELVRSLGEDSLSLGGLTRSQAVMLLAEREHPAPQRRRRERPSEREVRSRRRKEAEEAKALGSGMKRWLVTHAKMDADAADEAASELERIGVGVENLCDLRDGRVAALRIGKRSRALLTRALREARMLRFGSRDEAENCTFQPKITRSPIGESKRGEGEGKSAAESFLIGMEAKERARRQRMKDRVGQKEYDALLDKKVCPRCGNFQSYDEVQSNKKSCQECGVPFVASTSWNKVGRGFFARQEKALEKQGERRRRVAEAVAREERDSLRGGGGRRPLWHEVQDDFFRRLEESQDRAEAERRRLEEEQQPTFQPTLSAAYDFSGESFLDRTQSDIDKRRERMLAADDAPPGPGTYSIPRTFGETEPRPGAFDAEYSDEGYSSGDYYDW